eukprot:8508054-Ditylum_brightwellii.AAC.1
MEAVLVSHRRFLLHAAHDVVLFCHVAVDYCLFTVLTILIAPPLLLSQTVPKQGQQWGCVRWG